MKSEIGWEWSEDTLKSIIINIIQRRDEYRDEANTEFEKGVAAGYDYILDSIKNELECRGYNFEDWINDDN